LTAPTTDHTAVAPFFNINKKLIAPAFLHFPQMANGSAVVGRALGEYPCGSLMKFENKKGKTRTEKAIGQPQTTHLQIKIRTLCELS
jgi:hypothetical protein